MSKNPSVSIIVSHHNDKSLLKACLDALLEVDYPKSKRRIVVVDNCSDDDSLEFLRGNYGKKGVAVIENTANNYCRGCNLGISRFPSDYAVLLNNDVKVSKGWLRELVAVAESDNRIGAVTSKLLNRDGSIQNAGLVEIPDFYWDEQGAGRERKAFNEIIEIDAACGASVLFRGKAIKDAGLIDEDFVMFAEDVDISLRLRKKGWKILLAPRSLAYHKVHGSCCESFARDAIERNRLLIIAKHYPEKLSSSLVGYGHFLNKARQKLTDRLTELIPLLFNKLVKEHGIELATMAIKDTMSEFKRIKYFEDKKLETELKLTTDDLIETRKDRDSHKAEAESLVKQAADIKEELENLSVKLKDALDRVLLKDRQITSVTRELDDYRAQVAVVSRELAAQTEKGIDSDRSVNELKKMLKAYEEELNFLSVKFRESADKNLLHEGRIINLTGELDSHKEEINVISNKLIDALDKGLEKDAVFINLTEELKNHKDEISILSGKLSEALDKGLEKDNRLIRLEGELDDHKKRLGVLSGELRLALEEGLRKDDAIAKLENELSHHKEEVLNLAGKLEESLNSGLIKSRQVSLLEREISDYKEEIAGLTYKLQQSLDARLALEKELEGIRTSTGFRFLLSPLWSLLWRIKMILKQAFLVLKDAFWGVMTLLMMPALALHFIFFLSVRFMEDIFGRAVPKDKREIIPFNKLDVSIVIPDYNGIELLRKCLGSIFQIDEFKNGLHEVLVVDDASNYDIASSIREDFPRVRVIRNKRNLGFGRSSNRGIREAKGELIVLLNNDIMVSKDFLEPLKRHFRDDSVFAVSPKLYYWDKKTFNYGMHMGRFRDGYLSLWNEAETKNGDRVSETAPTVFAVGGAMAFRKRDFLWLGGFDDIFRPNCWEDIDISYRAQKRGLKVLYEPGSLMYHKGGATVNYARHKELKNELLFMWKNITDERMLLEHFYYLPKFFLCGKHSSRRAFLRGYLWAFDHMIPALANRFRESRYIKRSDRDILNRCMLYYRNFMRNNFTHKKKKTVLLITPFIVYPLNSGGKLRIYNLYKRLAKKYNLILLSLIHDAAEKEHEAPLLKVFDEVHTIHPKSLSKNWFFPGKYRFSYSEMLIQELKEIQETKAVDIVHIESNELLYLAGYIKYAPVIYTEHDISILFHGNSYYKKGDHSGLSRFVDHLKLVFHHNAMYKKVDEVVVLSRQDEAVVRAFAPEKRISFIQTGVDLEHFHFRDRQPAAKSLVFVGHYRHYPNEEAAVYFCREILPLIQKEIPDTTIKLVGSGPTEEVLRLSGLKGVEVVGEVLDVLPFLQEASVFVTAFRRSAGIKGKVLEAMAAGVPVVSTSQGACGINARHNQEIFIADRKKDFAGYVIELLRDEALNKRIAQAARKIAESQYDWDKLALKLERAYQRIITGEGYRQQDPAGIVDVAASGTREPQGGSLPYDPGKISSIAGKIDRIVKMSLGKLGDSPAASHAQNPEELHIELTHSCNSRCVTCDIWDYHKREGRRRSDELSLKEIKDLVRGSKDLKKIKTVVLSGGEPFLRDDLVDICAFIAKSLPEASFNILTNCLDTENVMQKIKKISAFIPQHALCIGTSLDGIGDIYDEMRGVKGGFVRFKDTISRLKEEFPQIKLSATFVLTPFNRDNLLPCWFFAKDIGIDFFAQFGVIKPARSPEVFQWKKDDFAKIREDIDRIISDLIGQSGSPEDFETSLNTASDKINLLTKIFYWHNLVNFQETRKRFMYKCDAGTKFAMLDPYGNVFFCPLLKDKKLGNVRDSGLDALWNSGQAENIRNFITGGNCSCWLVCTVFPIVGEALSLYGDEAAVILSGAPEKKQEIAEALAAVTGPVDEQQANFELNNREFRDRQLVLRSTAQGVTVGSNYACNADCMFCLGGEYKPFSLKLYKEYFEPRLGRILKQSKYISFCGMGELLLTPDIEQFLQHINLTLPAQNKILTTNGLALNKRVSELIMQGAYSVQVSLHASNPDLHAQITGLNGGFEKTIQNIRYIIARRKNKQSPYLVLVSVLNNSNIEDLPSFVEMAASLGADCVQCNYMTIFKQSHLKLSCFFKQEVTNEMLDKARHAAEELKISLVLPPRFGDKDNSYFKGACTDPWKNIYVDTEGAVLPCCSSGEHFGELNDSDIMSIWNNEKYRQLRKDLSLQSPVRMCRYCLNSNPSNVDLLSAHVSFRPEVQKEIFAQGEERRE